MNSALALLSLFLLLGPAGAAAVGADEPEACRAVAGFRPGPLAEATPADRERFAGSSAVDCQKLLYASGAGRDVEAARRCCLATGDCHRELAVIFANGWGVARDVETATWFLCRAGEEMAPFEQAGMLEHLAAMRGAAEPEDLDYCSQVTSGHGMSFCAGLDFDRAAAAWEPRLATVATALAPAARDALSALRAAADRFSELEGAFLADSSFGGTIYPSQALGERQAAFERFVAALERFTAERAPVATAEGFARTDRELNAAYRQAMSEALTETGRPALREAQRAWIALRDRWQALYRQRWEGAAAPAALEREIATALSATRARELLASRESP